MRVSSHLICLQHWLNNALDEKSVRTLLNIWNVSKILFTDIVSVFPWDKIANSKYLLSAYKGPDCVKQWNGIHLAKQAQELHP